MENEVIVYFIYKKQDDGTEICTAFTTSKLIAEQFTVQNNSYRIESDTVSKSVYLEYYNVNKGKELKRYTLKNMECVIIIRECDKVILDDTFQFIGRISQCCTSIMNNNL